MCVCLCWSFLSLWGWGPPYQWYAHSSHPRAASPLLPLRCVTGCGAGRGGSPFLVMDFRDQLTSILECMPSQPDLAFQRDAGQVRGGPRRWHDCFRVSPSWACGSARRSKAAAAAQLPVGDALETPAVAPAAGALGRASDYAPASRAWVGALDGPDPRPDEAPLAAAPTSPPRRPRPPRGSRPSLSEASTQASSHPEDAPDHDADHVPTTNPTGLTRYPSRPRARCTSLRYPTETPPEARPRS